MRFFSNFEIFNVLRMIYHITIYAVIALSLYKIAKNHHIRHPWIAFLPFLQFAIIGKLCEEYILLGVRIRPLWLVMILLALLQTLFTLTGDPILSLLSFAINLLFALILHKFFYMFEPSKAFLYAILSLLGNIPIAILLYTIKDKLIRMSAGAFPYPFANRR